jgi:hypothetical protein
MRCAHERTQELKKKNLRASRLEDKAICDSDFHTWAHVQEVLFQSPGQGGAKETVIESGEL